MDADQTDKRLLELEQKWLEGTISPEEEEEYAVWYNANQEEPVNIPIGFASGDEALSERILQSIRKRTGLTTPVVSMRKQVLRRRLAAAIILLLIGTSVYWMIGRHAITPIASVPQPPVISHDIAPPTGTRTTLTLGDGSRITLDSAGNGTLAREGNTRIEKDSTGEIAYHAGKGNNNTRSYNTLSTARGGQTMVKLSDGTKVWLNAVSSLRFPTVFDGEQRNVELKGEAYFEVAKSPSQPFRVVVRNMQVEVLGTSFNVMAYTEEEQTRTTLLEGGIRVSAEKFSQIMKPGQEARVEINGAAALYNKVDTTETIAWKNGLFEFNHAGIETLMRQIARWYDVDVVYEGKHPALHFGGKISRNVNASQILRVLEASGIHCRIEGRQIIVMP